MAGQHIQMSTWPDWQKEMVDMLCQGKELKIMMSGRKVGKSIWTQKAIDRLMKDLQSRPVEELVLGESRFAGARYYTVEPVGGNWQEMEQWCTETFGPASDVWDSKNPDNQFMWPECGRWYKNNRKFWFRNERDRDWFILRWNS